MDFWALYFHYTANRNVGGFYEVPNENIIAAR